MKPTALALLLLLAVSAAWAQGAPAYSTGPKLPAAPAGAVPGSPTALEPTALNLSPIWVQFAPALTVPVGDSGQYFTLGGDGTLLAEYRLPFFPMAMARGSVEYGFDPIQARQSISLASAAVGGGFSYNFIPNVGIKAYADAGATYGFFNRTFEGYWNPFLKTGLDAYFDLPPGLIFSVGAFFLYQVGLYTGIGLSIGASIGLGTPVTVQKFQPAAAPVPKARPQLLKGTGLDLGTIKLSDIYPVFYKYYDTHPIGTVVLHNFETAPVDNIAVSVFVKEFMDNPKEVTVPGKLGPGAEQSVDLFGLFTKDVLSNAEVTKVSASISLRYTVAGKQVDRDFVQTLRILDRNALTWDDNRKAAAFVSAKDPTAVKFAKNVASVVSGKANPVLDRSLLMAVAIHDALTLYGLTYSPSPIPTYTTDNQVADSIQFPQQTLDYRGGKCSDFSVLYSSLLEAVGIETAFITIPGHIYIAVGLVMGSDEARAFFQSPDDLIYQGDKAWLPLEITLREGGFLKAWELGAKEWRENKAKGTAALYSVRDSWQLYEPVGYSGTASDVKIPASDRLDRLYTAEVQAFIASETGRRESVLKVQAAKPGDQSKALNSLAVLHSRYGLFDKAEKELQEALSKGELVPALVNLGNIYFLQGKLDKAASLYDRAYKKAPANPTVLLCVARVNHAQENYALARKAYAALQARDPKLAERFSYLGLRGEEATRAADAAQVTGVVVWSD